MENWNNPEMESAALLFLSAEGDSEVDKSSIFLQLTQKEACYIHLVGLIAYQALGEAVTALPANTPSHVRDVAMHLTMDVLRTEKVLWEKVMGAILVQIFDGDAPAKS